MATSQPLSKPSLQPLSETLTDELQGLLCRASELRQRRGGRQRATPLPTSVAAFDGLLGGGLPRGSLVEVVGRGSCGRFALALAALRAVTGSGEAAALLDQGGQLDPQSAAAFGVDLERLLWLRPRWLPDTLAAAEMLVHTGFPLVTVDLGLPPVRGRAPLAAWLRLARGCAAHEAVVLVGAPYRLSGCAADAVVVAGRGRGRWSGRVGTPRLLDELEATLEVARRRGHRAAATATVALPVAEAVATRTERRAQTGEARPRREVAR